MGHSASGGVAMETDPVRMVTLIVAAHRDYLALVRTSATHVAALLLFSTPRVNDLRLAVDEACTSFLRPVRDGGGHEPDGHEPDALGPDGLGPDPADAATIQVCYEKYPAHLYVTVSARAPLGWPERDEVGWEMMSDVVDAVRVRLRDGIGTLTLIVALPTAADS